MLGSIVWASNRVICEANTKYQSLGLIPSWNPQRTAYGPISSIHHTAHTPVCERANENPGPGFIKNKPSTLIRRKVLGIGAGLAAVWKSVCSIDDHDIQHFVHPLQGEL